MPGRVRVACVNVRVFDVGYAPCVYSALDRYALRHCGDSARWTRDIRGDGSVNWDEGPCAVLMDEVTGLQNLPARVARIRREYTSNAPLLILIVAAGDPLPRMPRDTVYVQYDGADTQFPDWMP